MRSNVKKTVFLLLVLSILFLLPFETSANSPKPGTKVEIAIDQIPEGSVFADLLVKIDPSNEKYVAFNSEYGSSLGLDEHSEIATYNENGFTSYTFHFSGAVSENLLKYVTGAGHVAKFAYYTEDSNDSFFSTLNELERYSPILKLALLDEEGEILEISDEFNIVPDKGYFLGYIQYSPANDSITVSVHTNTFSHIFDGIGFILALLIAGFMRITFSIIAETLIAIPFRLKPYYRIIITNLVTQIILTLAFALSGFNYLIILIIIEVLVYIAEFIVYTILFKEVSKLKLLVYTIVANTVTLGFGLLLNELGIFRG